MVFFEIFKTVTLVQMRLNTPIFKAYYFLNFAHAGHGITKTYFKNIMISLGGFIDSSTLMSLLIYLFISFTFATPKNNCGRNNGRFSK